MLSENVLSVNTVIITFHATAESEQVFLVDANPHIVTDSLDLLASRLRLLVQNVVENELFEVVIVQPGHRPVLVAESAWRVHEKGRKCMVNHPFLALELFVYHIIECVSVDLHMLLRNQPRLQCRNIGRLNLRPRRIMPTLYHLFPDVCFVLEGVREVILEEPHVQIDHVELD